MLRGLGRQVSQRFVAASAGRSAGDLFGLRSFLRRLCAAFGWKYVTILASEYGVNQGTGLRLAGAARSYYLLDSVGMSSADYGHLSGFSHIPWQLKSVFGLLSDTVALGGLQGHEHLEGGDDAVTGGSHVGTDDMPGGFATEHPTIGLHHGLHVAVANLGAGELQPGIAQRQFQAEIGHLGAHHPRIGLAARQPVRGDDIQQLVTID